MVERCFDRNSLLVGLLLLIEAHTLSAQREPGGLQGVISDASTGETLPFANVVIEGTNLGGAANGDGFYLITKVPPGTYRVVASYVGYRIIVKNVTIREGTASRVSFELPPVPIELETVIKTGERFRRENETAVSMHAVGPQELGMVPAAVESDVFRVIRTLPGVVSTSDVTAQFFVRGGAGDQNLILLDGMTIYNPFHALSLFSIFDTDIIKYAEFQTGGFGVEHGTRLSSVLNIVTREGNRNRVAGSGSASFLAGKAMVEGPTPLVDGSWMISARKSYLDGTLRKFVNQRLPLSFYDAVGSGTLWFSQTRRFSFHVFASGDDIRNASVKEPNYRWRNRAFGLSYTQPLSNSFLVDITFSRSFFRGELEPKESNVRPSLSKVEDVYFYTNLTSFVYYPNELMLGFMYRLPRFTFSVVNGAGFPVRINEGIAEGAMWVQFKWEKPGKYGIEAGLRLNFNFLLDNFGSTYEPRINARLTLLPLLTLRAGFGRHHQQVITVTNEDDVIPLFESWIPVRSPFLPEEADHYVLGVESDPSQAVSLSVQGYTKRFRHLVSFNRDKVDRFDPDFVQGKGESHGVESLVRYTSATYYWWVAYTLGWASRTENGRSYAPRYDRRHTLNVVGLAKLGAGWEVGLRWELGSGLPFTQSAGFYDRITFAGAFDSTFVNEAGAPYTVLGARNESRLPVYHRLDVSLSKEITIGFAKLKAEVAIVNAYDRRNVFYFNRATGERIDQLPFFPTATLSASL